MASAPLDLWFIHPAQPWTQPRKEEDSKGAGVELAAAKGPRCGVGHGGRVTNTLNKGNNYSIMDSVIVDEQTGTKIMLQ